MINLCECLFLCKMVFCSTVLLFVAKTRDYLKYDPGAIVNFRDFQIGHMFRLCYMLLTDSFQLNVKDIYISHMWWLFTVEVSKPCCHAKFTCTVNHLFSRGIHFAGQILFHRLIYFNSQLNFDQLNVPRCFILNVLVGVEIRDFCRDYQLSRTRLKSDVREIIVFIFAKLNDFTVYQGIV